MIHKVRLLRGYRAKSGLPVYECACGEIMEAWYLREAQKIHQKELKWQRTQNQQKQNEKAE